jgi:16S rRNA (uracil1498-N3)-methyltransferase
MNLFYASDISGNSFTLNSEESKHIIRVFRMKTGDIVLLNDGKGYFYECKITDPNPKMCQLSVIKKWEGGDKRNFQLHIAIAPTKNIGRFEWFLEKSTEIGIDHITPIICEHSERMEVKHERLEKVMVAAIKQSLKSRLPVLDKLIKFSTLVKHEFKGQKFIAFVDADVMTELSKTYQPEGDVLILIGPEGDFSKAEIDLAKANGFAPVRLGKSRLRTETAGVVACNTINILNQ